MSVYELQPHNGRKSFYGKALVEVREDMKILFSYNTPTLGIDKDKQLHRYLPEHLTSTTTMTHIKSFVTEMGLDGENYNKSKFLSLDIEDYN